MFSLNSHKEYDITHSVTACCGAGPFCSSFLKDFFSFSRSLPVINFPLRVFEAHSSGEEKKSADIDSKLLKKLSSSPLSSSKAAM